MTEKEKAYLTAWGGTLLAVAVLIVLALGSDYLLMNRPQAESPVEEGGVTSPLPNTGNTPGPLSTPSAPSKDETPSLPSGNVTVSGRITCLPHKNTTGPQTMECATGLLADDGEYYALDLSAVTYSAGTERMRVSGHFTPTEALSTNMWQKYRMRGIIAVSSVEPL